MAGIHFGLSAEGFKKAMFTNPEVKRSISKVKYWYLRYQGANIMRSGKKNARRMSPGYGPGPYSNQGAGLAVIRYHYDRRDKAVRIGPLKFRHQPWSEKTVPQVVEEGGRVTPRRGPHWYKNRYGQWIRREAKTVRAQPYMRPALETNLKATSQKRVWSAARRKAGL